VRTTANRVPTYCASCITALPKSRQVLQQ
jgi:hypothetical protein